jgi:hypothetical protein
MWLRPTTRMKTQGRPTPSRTLDGYAASDRAVREMPDDDAIMKDPSQVLEIPQQHNQARSLERKVPHCAGAWLQDLQAERMGPLPTLGWYRICGAVGLKIRYSHRSALDEAIPTLGPRRFELQDLATSTRVHPIFSRYENRAVDILDKYFRCCDTRLRGCPPTAVANGMEQV